MTGKHALITGGSGGIGRATALHLASHGYSITVGFHLHQEEAQFTADQVSERGGRAHTARADVSEAKQAQALVESALEFGDGLDVIVCAAGVTRDVLLGASTADDFHSVSSVNLDGVINVCRAACATMIRQRSGSIVAVSSVAAQRPGRGQSNYAASKGGVEAFVRALAVELAPRNIRVNAVAPGVIATGMARDVIDLARDEIEARTLLGRVGEPAEVGRVAAFLASEEASFVTGQVWNVDGGWKLG